MSPDFVEWREEFISQERGNRMVHYYLEDASGESHLAVVGTEKSIRHMFYVVPEEFCHVHGESLPGVSSLKWRSKREVVGWLTKFAPQRDDSKSLQVGSQHNLGDEAWQNGIDDRGPGLDGSLKAHASDIVWSGVSLVCGKQFRHFQAFYRNGTTIPSHSFVLVLAEEKNRHLAYLDDMYEDKKGLKKVKVRWFHRNQEFRCSIPPPKPHPREVFVTPVFQVISAECVDGPATVLTPDHYERYVTTVPYTSAGIYLCSRQFNKNRFKPFDMTSLSGYFNQSALSYLDTFTMSAEEGLGNGASARDPIHKRLGKGLQSFLTDSLMFSPTGDESNVASSRLPTNDMRYGLPVKRPMSVKFVGPRQWLTPPYKVDDKIELLCQDSGIRGCWFRCTVLESSQKRLKVRYDDVLDEDECENLEEWVPAFSPATSDKLGMRCPGRLTIRPSPTQNYLPDDVAFQIGTPVDSWWNDGWWEGVVIGVQSSGDSVQVYLPGEDLFVERQRKDIRISRDWMRNQWVDVDVKQNILSAISTVRSGSTSTKGAESGSSAMPDRGIRAGAGEEDGKTPASLSSETEKLPDNVVRADPRKWCRDGSEGGADGACDGGVIVEGLEWRSEL